MNTLVRSLSTVGVVTAVVAGGPLAQEADKMKKQVALPHTEVIEITSRHVGADFEIWVAMPQLNPRMPAPDAYSVLYVTDANLFFGTAVEMTRLMHGLFGELPPILVVGIAYPSDDPAVLGEIRNRDFTPSEDARFEAMGKRLNPAWKPLLPEGERMGRANDFLLFIEEEVKPLIAGRYSVAASGHTLFGSSLGGLFTLHALLTRPGSFDNYIVASPSIWWDGEMLFGVEEQTASAVEDVAANVFIGVGQLEEGVGMPWLDEFRTVTNVKKMAERLKGRGYASLRIDRHIFEGETHTSVVPAVLTRGLRMVYGS
ncbi:MAG: alpha/beta hydrolase-fold protein [Gemmatimonadota bacterium]|nr:MAG: alpha/beta hydrolase-fold protein [Gemmatimonadota bacterium]